MTDDKVAPTVTGGQGTVKPKPKVVKFKVRKYVAGLDTHPVLFAHEDKALAERFVKTNHPRGKAVYLESPDGKRQHYSADHDFQGSADSAWQDWEDDDEDD